MKFAETQNMTSIYRQEIYTIGTEHAAMTISFLFLRTESGRDEVWK